MLGRPRSGSGWPLAPGRSNGRDATTARIVAGLGDGRHHGRRLPAGCRDCPAVPAGCLRHGDRCSDCGEPGLSFHAEPRFRLFARLGPGGGQPRPCEQCGICQRSRVSQGGQAAAARGGRRFDDRSGDAAVSRDSAGASRRGAGRQAAGIQLRRRRRPAQPVSDLGSPCGPRLPGASAADQRRQQRFRREPFRL